MRGVKTAEREGAMFHKNRTRKKDSKPKEAGYKLTYDNLAIPEVHTHEQPEIMDSTEEPGTSLMTALRFRKFISAKKARNLPISK